MSDAPQRVVAPDHTGRPLADLISLTGRRAVVTGGAQGIGSAVAERLAEAGADVHIGDLDLPAAKETAARVAAAHGHSASASHVDVREPGSILGFASAAADALGGLDIWVNNAGIYPSSPVLETSDELWDAVVDIDLSGTFRCCRAAAPLMSNSGDGTGVIVNIASMSSVRARANLAAYVAAKHGVYGLTKNLALELAPRGIRTVAVAPGLVDTPGIKARRKDLTGEELEQILEMERKMFDTIPLGRGAVADDIARIVLFAASDLGGFLNGSFIAADGGYNV